MLIKNVATYIHVLIHRERSSNIHSILASCQGASTKNFCHALWILVIEGVTGLSESVVKKENL